MIKILIGIIIVALLVCGLFIFNSNKQEYPETGEKVYSGPVRPTDDEDYFRKTGITKSLEVEE